MLKVIEKKVYVNGKNSVCIVKFSLNDDCKIYDYIHYKTIKNAFLKFYRKYPSIADGYNGVMEHTTFTVVGRAKCSPEDEFNEEKGIELATERAFAKVNKYNMVFIHMLSSELLNVVNNLENKQNSSEMQLVKNNKKIHKLSK